MLRKFTVVYLLVIVIMPLFTKGLIRETVTETDKVSVYFVDKQMMRLVETDYYVTKTDAEKQVKMVLSELIKGRDGNDKVRRMLPPENDAMKATVKEGIAYIDINTKYIDFYEKGKAQEQLIIYQIVNSVCSVEGIKRVKFLFDGKPKRDFVGEIDMREAFVPDYTT